MEDTELSGPWRKLIRRQVVVNMRGDRAFRGVLWDQRGPLLVLRNAVLHEPGQEPRGVDGEVVVERRSVEFIQFVTAEGD